MSNEVTTRKRRTNEELAAHHEEKARQAKRRAVLAMSDTLRGMDRDVRAVANWEGEIVNEQTAAEWAVACAELRAIVDGAIDREIKR